MRCLTWPIALLICALAVCGCETSPNKGGPSTGSNAQGCYLAIFSFPGSSAEESDEAGAKMSAAPGIRPLRTVALAGGLRLFFRSDRSAAEMDKSLRALGTIPPGCRLDTLVRLADGLPPKPTITTLPTVVVKADRQQCAAYGITAAEVASAVAGCKADQVDAIRKITLATRSGARVRVADVAAIRVTAKPSHIVRDHGDARKATGAPGSE